MNRTHAHRLGLVLFGVVVCLTATGRGEPARSNDTVSTEEAVLRKLRDIIIPEVVFRPPDTIIDAVAFLKKASRDFDKPELPPEQRGIDFVLKLPNAPDGSYDPSVSVSATTNRPTTLSLSAHSICLHDALRLVCDVTGMKFEVQQNGAVTIMPYNLLHKGMSRQAYTVLDSFTNHLQETAGTMENSGTAQKRDWQLFFKQRGVAWPEGSAISYFAHNRRFLVTNTPEQLAVLEQVLRTLDAIPRLLDIDLQEVAFRVDDIERLRLAGGVSKEALAALLQEGKARRVSAASVTTRRDHQTIMPDSQGMEPSAVPNWDFWDFTDGPHQNGSGVAIMSVGRITNLVPQHRAEDSTITLMLLPGFGFPDEPHEDGISGKGDYVGVPVRMPTSGSVSFPVITVTDGETTLLGGCPSPDGEWVHYCFLTARRINLTEKF